ncbi:MAG TPA: hypothetical protein VMY43_08200 [Methanothrix sp.]|nr:hypothetical protein [Methanothrix sp.]
MAHHIAKEGKLEETGRLQLLAHSLFAYYEPTILKILDRMIRIEFLRGRGRPLLVFTRKQLDFLPRGEIVSGQRTHDFIDAIANSQSSKISLSPCICQDALGKRKGCYRKDIVVLYGTEVYEKVKHDVAEISPEETKRLIEQLVEEGCMQTFYACMRSQGWMVVICNCEREICVPFRCHQLVGGVLHPGPDIIECREDLCIKCGKCVERCHFGANSLENGSLRVELGKCYGCGICVSSCLAEARRLTEREDYENMYYPQDFVALFLQNKRERISRL